MLVYYFVPERKDGTSTFKYNKKTFASLFLLASLGIAPSISYAQNDESNPPQRCFTNDYFNFQVCPDYFLKIRNFTFLDNGYYNDYGEFEPFLIGENLDNFDAGEYVTGNVLALSDHLTEYLLKEFSEKWSLDQSKILGVIETDSCLNVGAFAWVKKNNTSDAYIGPFINVGCASRTHKRQRACKFGSVGDITQKYYDILKGNSNDSVNVQLVFRSTTDFTPPDPNMDPSIFKNYPEEFLKAAGWSCPQN